MRFQIQKISDDAIAGWVILDNPSAVPRILVSMPDCDEIEIVANQMRPGLKNNGMHTTGAVGFNLNEKNCRGIKTAAELSIREAESGIVIYQRADPDRHLQKKLFLCQLQMMPQPRIQAALERQFAAVYHNTERYGGETLASVIGNENNVSVFMAGRPPMLRYQPVLRERGFVIVTLLQDPLDELAERIMLCHALKARSSAGSKLECPPGLEPLVSQLAAIDLRDEASYAETFRTLSTPQREALSNPYLRTLACDVDELPGRFHISSALDNLAAMDAVGLRSRYDDFTSMLREVLAADVLSEEQPFDVPGTQEVRERLQNLREVRDFLSLDIEFYAFASEAIEGVLAKT